MAFYETHIPPCEMVALLSIFPNNAAESFSPSIVPFQTFPLSNTFSRFSLNWTKHVKNISKKYRLKLFIKEMKENEFWFFSFDPKIFSFDTRAGFRINAGDLWVEPGFPDVRRRSREHLVWQRRRHENKKGWQTDGRLPIEVGVKISTTRGLGHG